MVCWIGLTVSPALGDCVSELRGVQSGFIVDFQQVIHSMNTSYAHVYEALHTKTQQIEQLEEDVRKLQDTLGQLNQENSDLNNQILDLRQHLRASLQDLNRHRDLHADKRVYQPFDTSGALSTASVDSGTSPRKRSSSGTSLLSPSYMRPRTPSRSAREESYVSAAYLPEEQSVRSNPGLNTPSKRPLALSAPANWLKDFREEVQRAMDTGRCRDISLNECIEMIERVYESKAIANDKAMQNVGNVPMETIEQHAYRTLEKKYGLRDLAVVHAGMLLKAINKYAEESNEVAVFQRIFRNEIEEDFRNVQKELQKSIKDLTLVQLMGRYPTKDQATITSMLETKLSSGVILEDEWRDMVGYLYNDVDANALCMLLRKQAVMERDLSEGPAVTISTPIKNGAATIPGGPSSSSPRSAGTASPYFHLPASQINQNKIKSTNAQYNIGSPMVMHHSADALKAGTIGYDRTKMRDVRRLGYSSRTLTITVQDPNRVKEKDKLRLPFPTFLKMVLDFQMQSHLEYLSNFNKIFRHVDRNGDGVLSAKEFHTFYMILRRVTEDSSVLAVLLQKPLSSSLDLIDRKHFDFHELDDSPPETESEAELQTLFALMKMLDPHETDRFTYSAAASVLHQIQTGAMPETTNTK